MFELPPASAAVTSAFIAVVAVVFMGWLVQIGKAHQSAAGEGSFGPVIRAAVFGIIWMAVHAGITLSGILESDTMPPRPLFYLFPTTAVVLFLCFRPTLGKVTSLPFMWLVGFQVFRLPLELVLHQLASEGVLPTRMTFEGANFDILTGVSALLLAPFADRVPRALIWVWNFLGLGLLITVVAIAVLSTPLPIRQFFDEVAVLLVFKVPFTFVASVLVMSALAGHVLVFRKLWQERGAS